MNTKPLGESNTVIRLRTSLENVRSCLVDLEALAHAARDTLDRLPYLPRPSGSEHPELEARLNYGRLQALVSATAASARDVLLECDQMLNESEEPPDDGDGEGGPEEPPDDEGDDDDDDGPAEPPLSSGNGEPHGAGSGTLPQAHHGVVEASSDDIDDGTGEPPVLIGGRAPGVLCVPRTRQSRGGIMLDVAAGPPELVPFVPGSAHGALQPAASA